MDPITKQRVPQELLASPPPCAHMPSVLQPNPSLLITLWPDHDLHPSSRQELNTVVYPIPPEESASHETMLSLEPFLIWTCASKTTASRSLNKPRPNRISPQVLHIVVCPLPHQIRPPPQRYAGAKVSGLQLCILGLVTQQEVLRLQVTVHHFTVMTGLHCLQGAQDVSRLEQVVALLFLIFGILTDCIPGHLIAFDSVNYNHSCSVMASLHCLHGVQTTVSSLSIPV